MNCESCGKELPGLWPFYCVLDDERFPQNKGKAVCCRCKGGFYEGIRYIAVGKGVYDVSLQLEKEEKG